MIVMVILMKFTIVMVRIVMKPTLLLNKSDDDVNNDGDLSVARSLDQVVQPADCRKPRKALVIIVMYNFIKDDYDNDDDGERGWEDTWRSSNKSSCSAANRSLPKKKL